MKDRTSKYPGRIKLKLVPGTTDTYDITWADEPQQEGTPLNKATLLSDTVAAALRLTQEDPTVSDAFAGVVAGFGRVTAESRSPIYSDAGKAGDLWLDLTNASNLEYSLYLCLGSTQNGAKWALFATFRKTLRTELIKTSGSWTVPGRVAGDATVMVYGAGGSGARHTNYSNRGGGGGGGGYRQVWTGQLNPGDVYYITIGAGGAGVASTAGKTGGTTSFGTVISAAGGSGASAITGGSGGSGGGGGSGGAGGVGYQFGSGGTDSASGAAGTNTTSIETLLDAQGTGSAGSYDTTVNYSCGGGGGGYGGMGGNGAESGGGGGGGFGANGNGGNGAKITGGSGGVGAGGGGCGVTGTSGAGGSGICMITYYVMEAA